MRTLPQDDFANDREFAFEAHEQEMDMRLKEAVEAYVSGEKGIPGPAAFEQIRYRLKTKRQRTETASCNVSTEE